MYRDGDRMEKARIGMVNRLRDGGISSGSVLEAMYHVPRHMFVSEALCYRAYDNTSLPIGFGQTISTPSVVASMVQALRLTGDERVLEIGSGSGYQAAVLAELSKHVIAMERIEGLAERSRGVLFARKYTNVQVVHSGDFNDIEGTFDRIIVAAGVEIFPGELLAKLNDQGILVIPVGGGGSDHQIRRYVKKNADDYFEEEIGRATFVPYITV